jgi:hypothetical protein
MTLDLTTSPVLVYLVGNPHLHPIYHQVRGLSLHHLKLTGEYSGLLLLSLIDVLDDRRLCESFCSTRQVSLTKETLSG